MKFDENILILPRKFLRTHFLIALSVAETLDNNNNNANKNGMPHSIEIFPRVSRFREVEEKVYASVDIMTRGRYKSG